MSFILIDRQCYGIFLTLVYVFMSKESIKKKNIFRTLSLSMLSNIYYICVRHRSKKCRNKENTYFLYYFMSFRYVLNKFHTSAGHWRMSDTATYLTLDVYVFHRMNVIKNGLVLCQGFYVSMVNLMNGENHNTSSASEW